ncbi:MAG: sn-glycerol-3-phosphate ABC transporter ATP-binding protein UgpC [Alphaproteobacteria bacterium]|nr:sn-glycerol-3-phosphate ABC transporter ATP-binding protein UgpC [Alphaproteobacteria bacterium]MDE2112111.1 sn-glycerol-3-phosphate ABC transporter ATP-binding protein UgpC [Alphaproteobacteria bacterium]MDE2493909.1 sn-glycerol-3-phosphate ABC transporter ATP-binding protein UgpC [Alphaproteobacteria bacterium]
MPDVALKALEKTFGAQTVLKGVDLAIKDGEFVVIVGPSGCGKSTLLRIIAGLEDPTSGDVTIDGQSALNVSPAKRGVAMVFQSYALYPHLSVFENMAFALRIANHKPADVKAAVERAARVLGIEPLLDRKPKALSGGQRQRVAIGRAIVRQPRLFLLDEPLSNLDAGLRVHMRHEFARLHRELKTTTIYVTHDQVEAMTLADKIVVLNDGRIEQVGSSRDVYHAPKSLFVASFLGTPRMNLIPGEIASVSKDHVVIRLIRGEDVRVPFYSGNGVPPARPGDPVTIGVRPDALKRAQAPDGRSNSLTVRVDIVETLGGSLTVYGLIDKQDAPVIALLPASDALTTEEPLRLSFCPEDVYLFDAEGRAFARNRP